MIIPSCHFLTPLSCTRFSPLAGIIAHFYLFMREECVDNPAPYSEVKLVHCSLVPTKPEVSVTAPSPERKTADRYKHFL
jgi:hypothetical protein